MPFHHPGAGQERNLRPMRRLRRILTVAALVAGLLAFRNKKLAEDEARFTSSRQT